MTGAALLGAVALATYPLIGLAPEWRPLIFLGLLGVSGLALGMAVAWPAAVGWSLSALVIQYGLSLVGDGEIDGYAVLYVASLFVTAELCLAVIEGRPAAALRQPMTRFEIMRVVAFSMLAAAMTGFVLVVTSVDLPHWRWLPPVAVGAATAAFSIVVSATRRPAVSHGHEVG